MTGRLALVIGSQCVARNTLDGVAELATELYGELRKDDLWESATAAGGPVLNPTYTELRAAVEEAFARASEREATLFISFLGHGVDDGDDYYLLATDSPERPKDNRALDFSTVIKNELKQARLDGLIVLVDACDAGAGLVGAAKAWLPGIHRNAGRLDLLCASADGPAFNACFTRTTIAAFREGVRFRGQNLLTEDLIAPLRTSCLHQQPQRLATTQFRPGAPIDSDPSLWLVPNRSLALNPDSATDRPASALVDQLIAGVELTDDVRNVLEAITENRGPRLRAVIGPAGAGKSTALALLVRPTAVVVEAFPTQGPRSITAAVFLDVTSSLESVTSELVQQLTARMPGYADAAVEYDRQLTGDSRSELSVFERMIIGPLTLPTKVQVVEIIVDGLDQPEPGNRAALVAALSSLTTLEKLRFVRLIVGIRAGTGLEESDDLAHMTRIEVTPPTGYDLVVATRNALRATRDGIEEWGESLARSESAVPGGWLVARLLRELSEPPTAAESTPDTILSAATARRIADAIAEVSDAEMITKLLAVLVAAGAGPVIPLDVVVGALEQLGVDLDTPRLRTALPALGSLIARAAPGTDAEQVGLTHSAFLEPVQTELERNAAGTIAAAHRAIVATFADDDSEAAPYERAAGVRHFILCDRSKAALDLLMKLNSHNAADNRDRWAAALDDFTRVLGPDHPDTLTTRHSIAYWRGHTGDITGALTDFQQLLTDRTRVLELDHPDILRTRSNIAYWRGETGDTIGALADFQQLLTDESRVLGPDHPDALRTRSNIASWRGYAGDTAAALTDFQQLLTDQSRVLGPDHPATLTVRNNIAYWRSETGDTSGALTDFQQLVTDQARILGPDHPDTLRTRNNIASWRGDTGDTSGALADSQQLLTDRTRILGPDHPDTLRTRNNIA
ncbi:tetratricopeptide repeat protein, partial [Nocardia sp. NPDC057663]|uniref:tetratricopeptide repeat protein n=1 Tax=Nocardia sp. NPDC057663 TaxID=3346201 RepID=UPI00366DE45E